MCIAIYKPAGKTISEETLRNCWENNPDGAGFMFVNKRGDLVVRKGFMKLKGFLKEYNSVENSTDIGIAIHFRIATHGSICPANTHPFWIKHGKAALIHNGIISIVNERPGKDFSDTQLFIKDYLLPIYNRFSECFGIQQFNKMIEKTVSGSKIIIMESNGNVSIINEGGGVWESDVWFSNRTFVKYTKYVVCREDYFKGNLFDRKYLPSKNYNILPNKKFTWEDDVLLEVEEKERNKEGSEVYLCSCGERFVGKDSVYWASGATPICPECGEELF